MVGFAPVWLNLVVVFLVAVAMWWLVVAAIFWFNNRNFKYARGASGQSGDSVVLRCPVGTNMTIEQLVLVCEDVDSTGKTPTCDPFNNDGTINTQTTQDIKAKLAAVCNGNETCTFTIPNMNLSSGSSKCTGCQQSQLIGTYSCQA
jgi:hypothetical protein